MMSAANAAPSLIEFPFNLSELPESDLARQARAVQALANFMIANVASDANSAKDGGEDSDVDKDEVRNSELREIYVEYELHNLEARMLTMFAREAVRQATEPEQLSLQHVSTLDS